MLFSRILAGPTSCGWWTNFDIGANIGTVDSGNWNVRPTHWKLHTTNWDGWGGGTVAVGDRRWTQKTSRPWRRNTRKNWPNFNYTWIVSTIARLVIPINYQLIDKRFNFQDYALNALFIDWMQQHRDFYKRATETVDKENSMPIIPTISIWEEPDNFQRRRWCTPNEGWSQLYIFFIHHHLLFLFFSILYFFFLLIILLHKIVVLNKSWW